ncbi:DUF6169 family protein [Mucilaginibacter sp. FT3.2]|uniref:DUF6169 family protein n=1 Tax=Mucilaginibacter sp. FT3.2 TaxID=2723090 RepID=UPI00161A8406|nr:DUF6169 family protein [Mucilaginibacter sp. FT3.2]MBB6231398.1 hypothetical protein [Mucilaginibacter sp. FT3.2]
MPKPVLPYNLLKYDNGQAYFETDHGHIYTYNFENVTSAVIEHVSPLLAAYDITFYYFGFTPDSSENLKFDPRISSTINNIANKFFNDKNRVLLYVCDSMDGRAKARQKLFAHWLHNNDYYTLHKVNIEIGEDVIYCGVITRADLPDYNILDSEFIAKAEDIFTKKF